MIFEMVVRITPNLTSMALRSRSDALPFQIVPVCGFDLNNRDIAFPFVNLDIHATAFRRPCGWGFELDVISRDVIPPSSFLGFELSTTPNILQEFRLGYFSHALSPIKVSS
jgi:hypothetical protein